MKKEYWNGKTSDHPVVQKMTELDNSKFQVEKNVFDKRKC